MTRSEKPYSLSTAALLGSATAGSVLVCGEPCICHPPNCCGRIAECSPEPAGVRTKVRTGVRTEARVAGLSAATAIPSKHAREITTPTEREKPMNVPGPANYLTVIRPQSGQKSFHFLASA